MTHGNSGFSLVEVLVSVAISLTVTVVATRLAAGAQAAWRVASARVDLQQRARVAADVLSHSLLAAGGGPHTGVARGRLLRHMPPVLPRRIGRRGAHGSTEFRRDAFTVVHTSADATHATLLRPADPGATTLELAPVPGCAVPTCGVSEGATILLLTTSGVYELFTITAIDDASLSVRRQGAGSGWTFAAGTPVLAVDSSSFSIDAAASVLRKYDGDASDVPLVDDVVGMDVRYYGDVRAPLWPRPPAGEANCLYAADGTYNAALMPALAGAGGLAELTAATLTDGPWCGAGETQFDADLLRIRRIRVSLRLQAADPVVRGRDPRFRVPGRARSESSMVADLTVTIDTSPRNLGQ
jgi:prepilin-type N-terminal cleavage/methylation domain-containing protein